MVEADPVALWRDLDPGAESTVVWAAPPSSDRVVFLLGAFDPPTNAHLEILRAAASAEGATATLCLTKVLLARGGPTLLTDEQRVGVLHAIAVRTRSGFALANRGRYLEVHRALESQGIEATFVIGSDKLRQLEDPSFYQDGSDGVAATFSEVRFLVVPRAGTGVEREDVAVLDPAEVFEQPWTADLSATVVRAKVASGGSVDELVPPEVASVVEGYTAAR